MPSPSFALAAGLVALAASPAHAGTIAVTAGPDAQQKLQEALILAKPGDIVQLAAGRYVLTDGLSLDVNGVTVRGAGMDATVLDFSGQQGAGEGLLVTSDDVTLRDFAVLDAHGDGIKSKGADRIVYFRVRAAWTGGPKETNGAYGIYPVESTGVLIDGCQVEGASDAGIYVGQSKDITVRYSLAQGNVAGVEIENSRNALVAYNLVTRNTGGILVFDLPNLPVMGGGNTVLTGNLVVGNDTPNFAPKGNIVAAVRRGTGVMVMANDGVRVTKNVIRDNPTSGVMVVSYPRPFTDKNYNPTPRNVMVDANAFAGNGLDPQLPGATELKAAFGGAVPPVIWDGIGPAGTLMVDSSAPGLSLNLPGQGAGPEAARPALFTAATQVKRVDEKSIGAPAALDVRIAG
ncbi:parallel beta-helix domain-containing protein [Novosphingobium tardum]|uniref:Parallel beta-helix domain-containing protein n=1 Tax=Novosphingobium tardum TaxID=1538021 RepID=A0ABV8RQ18_9SPHN